MSGPNYSNNKTCHLIRWHNATRCWLTIISIYRPFVRFFLYCVVCYVLIQLLAATVNKWCVNLTLMLVRLNSWNSAVFEDSDRTNGRARWTYRPRQDSEARTLSILGLLYTVLIIIIILINCILH